VLLFDVGWKDCCNDDNKKQNFYKNNKPKIVTSTQSIVKHKNISSDANESINKFKTKVIRKENHASEQNAPHTTSTKI
jgi:hypothetical protein